MSAPRRNLPGIPKSPSPNGYVLVGFQSEAAHSLALSVQHRQLVQTLAGLANVSPPNDPELEPDFDAVQARLAIQALVHFATKTGVDHSLLMPVLKAVSAFDHREKGGDPALFKTVKGGVGGRPGVAAMQEARRLYAVLLMNLYRKREKTWKAAADRAAGKLKDVPGHYFWHDLKKANHRVDGKDIIEWRGDILALEKNDPSRVQADRLLAVALQNPAKGEAQLINFVHDLKDGRAEALRLMSESEKSGNVISSVGADH